jgi:hypothetical protein
VRVGLAWSVEVALGLLARSFRREPGLGRCGFGRHGLGGCGSSLQRRRLGRGRRIRCGSWPGEHCQLQHDCIDLAAQLDQLALQGFHIQRGRCDRALDGRTHDQTPQTHIGTRVWFIGYWSPEP